MSEKTPNSLQDELLFEDQKYLQIKESIFQNCQRAFIEENSPLNASDSLMENKTYRESYSRNYALAKIELNKKRTFKIIHYSLMTSAAIAFFAWVVFFYFKNTNSELTPEISINRIKPKIIQSQQSIKEQNEFSRFFIQSDNIDISKYLIKSKSFKLSDFKIEENFISDYITASQDFAIEKYLINDEELIAILNKDKFGYMKTKDQFILITQNGHRMKEKFAIK